MILKYSELTRLEMEQINKEETIVLIPLGALEQHGNQAPLGTDDIIAQAMTEYLTRALEAEDPDFPMLIFPVIPVGLSTEHKNFCGSITLKPDTYYHLLYDICASLAHHGFKKLALLICHGGNAPIAQVLSRELRSELGISPFLLTSGAFGHPELLAGLTGYVPGLFKHVYTGTRADVKRALPPAEMGQALDISASLHRELKEAQIWFALLFLLRGMPFADLARLRKCDFKDGVITYRRQKTGRQIRVHVTEEAAELIRRCADRRTDSPYLLNILGDENCRFPLGRREEYRHYQQVLRRFNRKLKLLAAALRLGGKLSSYVAKHNAFAI